MLALGAALGSQSARAEVYTATFTSTPLGVVSGIYGLPNAHQVRVSFKSPVPFARNACTTATSLNILTGVFRPYSVLTVNGWTLIPGTGNPSAKICVDGSGQITDWQFKVYIWLHNSAANYKQFGVAGSKATTPAVTAIGFTVKNGSMVPSTLRENVATGGTWVLSPAP